jgi:hypothetical protein
VRLALGYSFFQASSRFRQLADRSLGNIEAEPLCQIPDVCRMRGIASVLAGLQCEQALRLVTLASLKQDERADNSRNDDQMVVVGEMAKFSEKTRPSIMLKVPSWRSSLLRASRCFPSARSPLR